MSEYFVDPSAGDNGNSGTSFANAWATTPYAKTQVSAGDVVNLCATAVETVSGNITFTVDGTDAAPILWRGRDGTDGTTDAKYTIQASAVLTSIIHWSGTNGDHNVFRNLIIDGNGNAAYGFYQTQDGLAKCSVYSCQVTDTTSHGMQIRSDHWDIIDTEVDNCGGYGIYQVVNRCHPHVVGCNIHDNGNHGFRLEGGLNQRISITHTLIWNNDGDGISIRDAYGDRTYIGFCTIHNNTDDGIVTGSDSLSIVIAYNSITDNGGYGQNHGGTTEQAFSCIGNLHNGNTSGATNGSATQYDELTSSPDYVDESTGDFTPDTGSPLIGAGPQGSDIGAVAHAAGGGGGGGTSVTPFSIQNLQAGVLG